MKLRRAILASIVIGGFLLLILGVLGVFSRTPKPAPDTSSAERAVSDTAPLNIQIWVAGFEMKGEGWSLNAAEARTSVSEDVDLKKPVLHFTRTRGEETEQIEISSDEGTYAKEPEQRISMSGNVKVTWQGPNEAVLTAESLEIKPEAGYGRSDGAVTLSVVLEEGPQKAGGKGVEILLEDRVVTIEKDVRLELTGRRIFPEGGEETTPPPILVTCDGPVRADGYRRSIEFKNKVTLQQGENLLQTGDLTVELAPDTPELERFVAEGDVRIQAQGAVGQAERLLRTALDDQIILEGHPAVIQQGGGRITAERLEMALADGAIIVPSEGALGFESPEGSEGPPVSVSWSRMLRFNTKEHQALFDGDVRFDRGEQSIRCRRLAVKLDSENREILECRADDDVGLTAQISGRSVTASGESLLYNPANGGISLIGNGAVDLDEGTISGERIEFDQANSLVSVRGAGRLKGAAAAEAERQPFEVAWTGGMVFKTDSRESVFERGVSLDHSGQTLKADRVVGTVDEGGALQGFKATGSVQLVKEATEGDAGRSMFADNVEGEMGAGGVLENLVAKGNARVEERGADNSTRNLQADRIEAEVSDANVLNSMDAEGNVVMVLTDSTKGLDYVMRSENAQARVGPDNRITEFVATGQKVTVQQADQIAEGTRLVWNLEENNGILFGSPVVFSQGRNRLIGDRIEFQGAEGSIRVTSETGRVEATLTRNSKGKSSGWPF
jgi:lipopolysaccharide transport protein LptA